MSALAGPVATRTFVRGVEYWLPDADGLKLGYGGGWYGAGTQMSAVSRETHFVKASGLPGRAWALEAPVVLHAFEGSYFMRTEAALADGLTCGIALPIFADARLLAVAVFFCGDDDDHAGAIEVWRNDPAVSKDMALDDGHYGRTAETFEYLSRRTVFRAGTGLPGQAWQRWAPVFLGDLGRASGFLRQDGAQRVGITRGLAVPCPTPGPTRYVMTFLSALGTPIARRLELWRVGASGTPTLEAGFCEQEGLLHSGAAPLEPAPGIIAACAQEGVPRLATPVDAEAGTARLTTGHEALFVLPLLQGAQVTGAVAFYF